MEEKVLIIRGDEITALYSDDLRELGNALHVERASDVEWDDEAQGWYATIHCDRGDWMPMRKAFAPVILGPFTTREEALAAEVAHIQSLL